MALSSLLKPKRQFLFYRFRPPPLTHLHRYSSSSNDEAAPGHNRPRASSSSSSYEAAFADIKAKIRDKQPAQAPPLPRPGSLSASDDIRKNLSEFRRRSAAPDSWPPAGHSVSFEELYHKSLAARGSASSSLAGTRSPLQAIRETLKRSQLNSPGPAATDGAGRTASLFKSRPSVAGGTQTGVFAGPFFVEEEEREGNGSYIQRLFKGYSHEELGKRLAELRPNPAERKQGENEGGGGWFSLEELRERLQRFREIEAQEEKARTSLGPFGELRDALAGMKRAPEKKAGQSPIQRSIITLGTTPAYMMMPPKEHLVDKYFHPDNMSASEKLKIELAKVRDEFKMSESDCGSARVQVAQLTTKIKYLSSVLYKKDKHSLRGLQRMVQQRKKLLKYLRRTDWDSYCFVLDKLGLRDNPDYKIRSQ